jgi:hypothetical protein
MPEAVGDAITRAVSIQRARPRQTDPRIKEAWEHVKAGAIPLEAYAAYRVQFGTSKRRGIPFLFTLPEWWDWWLVGDRWNNRGLKGNGLVMARFGDVGPYSPRNVYCATARQNCQDVDHQKRSLASSDAWRRFKDEGRHHHLEQRGDGHPRSKAVITPAGRFGSVALAAEHFGLTRQGAALRARKGQFGWRYEVGLPES